MKSHMFTDTLMYVADHMLTNVLGRDTCVNRLCHSRSFTHIISKNEPRKGIRELTLPPSRVTTDIKTEQVTSCATFFCKTVLGHNVSIATRL